MFVIRASLAATACIVGRDEADSTKLATDRTCISTGWRCVQIPSLSRMHLMCEPCVQVPAAKHKYVEVDEHQSYYGSSSEDGEDDAGAEEDDSQDDDDEAEMFGSQDEEEYQKLRRIEVSQKIQRLAKSGINLRQVEEEMSVLEEEDISVDAKLATGLINAYMRTGNLEAAQQLFHKYFEEGDLEVDDVVIGVLLRGLGADNPPQWAKITSLLSRMEQEHKLRPSIVVYNELLHICSRSNAIGKGMQIIDEMARRRMEPDEYTLDAVGQRKSLRSHLKKVYAKIS